jgi:hypothetical protein
MENGNSIAWMSLMVAMLSSLTSIILLIWQILKHFLDGPRVQMHINTAFYDPEVEIGVNQREQFTYKLDKLSKGFLEGRCVELCQMIIENPGREAVTLYSPGLELKFSGRKKYISPELYKLNIRGVYEGDVFDKYDVCRLKPYDRTVLYFDYWNIVNSVVRRREGARGKKIILRGSVRVAGKNNKYHKTKKRWVINSGVYTAIEGNPKMTTYRVLLSSMSPYMPQETQNSSNITRYSLKYILQPAMKKFNNRPGVVELAQALEEHSSKVYGDHETIFYPGIQAGYQELDARGYSKEDWL